MVDYKFVQMVQVTHVQDGRHVPYMVKTLQKSSSPEPPGRLPWNLVYSIGDSGPIIICSNDDPGMTMTYFIPRSNLVT